MANETLDFCPVPPYASTLPSYTLKPVPRLLPWLSDFHLSLVLPVAAYWLMSLIFWYIDKKDYFSKYRLHTPEEFKQRNRVTVAEVLRSVLFQQAVQTALGLFLGYVLDAGDFYGKEEHDVVVWAGRVHRARDAVPWILGFVGIDAKTLGHQLQLYSASLQPVASMEKPLAFMDSIMYQYLGSGSSYGFTSWEIRIAQTIYWVLEPAARFGMAIFFSDSWQYFWHRAMHSNQWMYRNMHAHHHKIYIPYAFGAFYNTLSEAFLLDTVGTTISLMLSGLTIRQTMCFSTISVMKGVDDHCGYRLPWDPLQWLGEQDTRFHDVHHQAWGIKLYTTFWDHVCGTVCAKSEEEVERLYERGRTAAETKAKAKAGGGEGGGGSVGGDGGVQ
ncbi:MAG: hypothetical protein Q9219_002499 [cf. Caloplaca sp. 3 TL-2023]